jgi:hypothetical protein
MKRPAIQGDFQMTHFPATDSQVKYINKLVENIRKSDHENYEDERKACDKFVDTWNFEGISKVRASRVIDLLIKLDFRNWNKSSLSYMLEDYRERTRLLGEEAERFVDSLSFLMANTEPYENEDKMLYELEWLMADPYNPSPPPAGYIHPLRRS